MSQAAGYSGTPLAQKLGLRDGQRALFIDLPQSLAALATAREFAESRQMSLTSLPTPRRAMTLSISSPAPVPCSKSGASA